MVLERVVLASENYESARYRIFPLAQADRFRIDMYPADAFPQAHQINAIEAAAESSTILILQRTLPTVEQMRRLRLSFRAIVFDIDDALYAVPPNTTDLPLVDTAKRAARLVLRGSTTASLRRGPLIRTLRDVDVAVVGNPILGDFVCRYAARVIVIPTTVSPAPTSTFHSPPQPIVVWMGLPDNLGHLELIRRPLEQIRRSHDFAVRIVSSRPWENPPFPAEFVAWSERTYRASLLSATIGVAPLSDDPWTRGKCALRSIQYGGHGLPTIASPVGITDRVVLHGKTGYLARTPEEWAAALRCLLMDPVSAASMGANALRHIRDSFSDDIAVERWSQLLSSL